MRLRVIDFGTVSALRSQAVYHGIAETVDANSDPTLLLVSPGTPYVCVGVHQEIEREVDEDYCRSSGLPVYRRQVGGGAVYLDENQLFTHFIYPRAKAPEFSVNLYPLFIEPVVRTYQEIGVNAEYRPINDIQVGGRKIGGTGAASIGEATVMVGSFMFDFDTEGMAKCLKVPSEKFRDKLRQTLNDYMTTMKRELRTPPPRDEVKSRFLKHCAAVLSVEPAEVEPTAEEIAAIDAAEARLSDPAWTYRQGRKLVELGVKISAGRNLTESMHKAPGGLIRVHLLDHDGAVGELMISGDYTCRPIDGFDQVALRLQGVALEPAALKAAAGQAMDDLQLDTPGITADDLSTAIMAAVEKSG